MFKKYRLVVALVVVGLLSGGMLHSVDASASSEAPSQNITSEENANQVEDYYFTSWKDFFERCFGETNYKRYHGHKVDNQVTQPTPSEPNTNNNNQNNVPNQEVDKTPTQNENQTEASELNEYEQQVVDLTNAERVKYGLAPFEIDAELSKVAREKSRDISVNNYFDHNSPVYGSPFDMMESFGISYRTAGENIARGQQTPTEVVNAWMNSEGHRANILNGNFTRIGVGYVAGGNVWTQQFIGQ